LGTTWTNAATDLIHFNGVANLALDPRDAKTLYAIIGPNTPGRICGAAAAAANGRRFQRRSTTRRLTRA